MSRVLDWAGDVLCPFWGLVRTRQPWGSQTRLAELPLAGDFPDQVRSELPGLPVRAFTLQPELEWLIA